MYNKFYVLYETIYNDDQIDSDKLWGYYDSFTITDMRNVSLPACVKVIGAETFSNLSTLERILLPPSVRKIDSFAFKDCPNLKEITIPPSVTEIADNAFENCGNVMIRGKKGSAAERYAKENGFGFEEAASL